MNPIHIALLNFFLCGGVFWSCVCRLNSEHSKQHRRARARYVILLAGSMVHGLQPTLFGTWPGSGGTVFSAMVLAFLGLSMHRWRKHYDVSTECDRRGV